jgi:hypothetical protein
VWDGMPISAELPPAMVEVMMPYIKQGHTKILRPNVEGPPPYLFCTAAGEQMKERDLSDWWQRVNCRHSTGFRFPAQNLRDVWSSSLGDMHHVTDEEREALARIMGHTLGTERLTYDQHLPQRIVQGSLSVCTRWRKQLLNA